MGFKITVGSKLWIALNVNKRKLKKCLLDCITVFIFTFTGSFKIVTSKTTHLPNQKRIFRPMNRIFHAHKNLCLQLCFKKCTVCPRSSDRFYVVSFFIKWVTTSWAYSTPWVSRALILPEITNIWNFL